MVILSMERTLTTDQAARIEELNDLGRDAFMPGDEALLAMGIIRELGEHMTGMIELRED